MYKYFLSIFLFLFLFAPIAVDAANPKLPVRDDRYAARYVSQTVADPVVIEAGHARDITFTFKNTGSATWVSETGAYITAFTVEPKYRTSPFSSAWISNSQAGRMSTNVAPGATGEMTITLTAPTKPGTYREEFYLAANSYSWLENGYFYIDITVVPATSAPVQVPETVTVVPEVEEEDTTPEIASAVSPFFLSTRSIELEGGVEKRIKFGVRNISGESLEGVRVVTVSSSDAMFAHDSWLSSSQLVRIAEETPIEGRIKQDFYIYTPAKAGVYEFSFALATSDGILPGSTITIPVKVTADAPQSFVAPEFAASADPFDFSFDEEPRIRVGLAKIDSGSMTFVSDVDYALEIDGARVYTLAAGTPAVLQSNGSSYVFSAASTSMRSATFLRLEPIKDMQSTYTLGGGFDRDISWMGRTDFDEYHGAVELRHAVDSAKTLYAIGELLLEDYVAGVAEVSNGAPTEFLKAQSVLARTYAIYIMGTNKHESRHFDVVAHTGDQLYLGAGIESTTPNYYSAVKDTRGEMVLYDGNIVITPYFGNSDGQTRSFEAVWGGANRPWLVPVTAEYDLGRKRYGHGVGMSQRDAMARATEQGLSYDQLIKYYYTDVTVDRLFE